EHLVLEMAKTIDKTIYPEFKRVVTEKASKDMEKELQRQINLVMAAPPWVETLELVRKNLEQASKEVKEELKEEVKRELKKELMDDFRSNLLKSEIPADSPGLIKNKEMLD